MNRSGALCAMNRAMMETFSRRTVEGLHDHSLFRLVLPPFRSFLDLNVAKEVDKDRRVIRRAAEALQHGATPGPTDITALLREAREIDRSFLRRVAVVPVDVHIRYDAVERYRQRRIDLLLHASYRILARWREVPSFRATVQSLYDETAFRGLLHDILTLYAAETRMLSRSVRIPRLLTPARDAVTRTVTAVMEQQADTLAGALARTVYRRPAAAPADNQQPCRGAGGLYPDQDTVQPPA